MQFTRSLYRAGRAARALTAFGVLAALAAGCATTGLGAQRDIIAAKDKVAPALVHIRPVKEVFARGQREEVLTVGSGFIISPDGYVVTNEHVAGESRFVLCVLSDRGEVEAEVVGVDPFTDVAVLKLDVDRPLPYARMGRSDTLTSGQVVLALGSPHGLARSVSMGIVSVTDRHLEGRGTRIAPYNTWIQTDAAINPGNSGGPLVNLRGEVIGVNARTLMGADNVGFAIPIDVVREVADELIAHGRVRRGWIGVEFQEMLAKTDDPKVEGVVIADVDPLSPGREAGLLPGDVLVAVDGAPVNARFEEDLPGVRKLIADKPAGSEVALTIARGDATQEIRVRMEEQSALRGAELEFPEWGFTARDLTPEAARRAQLDTRAGVLVTGVQVGGIASDARLQQGDIILEVDEEKVTDLADFRRRYETLVETEKALTMLWVRRGALTRFVLVKQQGGPPVEPDTPLEAPVTGEDGGYVE